MLEGWCTQIYVANVLALGVLQGVVSGTWTRYHAFGTAVRRHTVGRQRTTTREDQCLALQAGRNQFISAQTLPMDATGTSACIQTTRNRPHDVILRARRSTYWETPTTTIRLGPKSRELDCCRLDLLAVHWWVQVLFRPHWWSCWVDLKKKSLLFAVIAIKETLAVWMTCRV
jgi:hypothetical protein